MGEDRLIWLDREELLRGIADHPTVPADLEAAFTTSPSQYDVPEALRSYRDEHGHCVIEFKYIGPDEPIRTFEGGELQILTGKNSGRIYRILIEPTATPKPQQVTVGELHKAIDTVANTHPYPRMANYRLIDFVVDRHAHTGEIPCVVPDMRRALVKDVA